MHHPTDRIAQDSICYTSHGTLAGTRNSSIGPPWRIDLTTHRTMSRHSYHKATSRCSAGKKYNVDCISRNICQQHKLLLDVGLVFIFLWSVVRPEAHRPGSVCSEHCYLGSYFIFCRIRSVPLIKSDSTWAPVSARFSPEAVYTCTFWADVI